MSIQVDWEFVEKEEPEKPEPPPPPPPPRPRRRVPLWVWVSIVVAPIIAGLVAWLWVQHEYQAGLRRAEAQVRQVAHMETQAADKADRATFMALQDPEDLEWRRIQEQRFLQLETNGVPEWGWAAAGIPPQLGEVTLEPGGAGLDMTYQFTVTEPMPGGPDRLALYVPQFYRQTPSGWVRAWPRLDYWGGWRRRETRGQRLVVIYAQRDAQIVEPWLGLLEKTAADVCNRMACPNKFGLLFDIAPDSLLKISTYAGFDSGMTLYFPSPHLLGLPVDAASDGEWQRLVASRLVQALVYEASDEKLNTKYLAEHEVLQWELVQAGLAPPAQPFSSTLAGLVNAAPRSLAEIPLRPPGPVPMDTPPKLIPLALSFIELRLGAGSTGRLLPAIPTHSTMGEAIQAAFGIEPAELETAWADYVRGQVPLPAPNSPRPQGELALACGLQNPRSQFIQLMRTDGQVIRMVSSTYSFLSSAWSPDGNRLAWAEDSRVRILDVPLGEMQTVTGTGLVGWLPDGRLWLMQLENIGGEKQGVRVWDLDSGGQISFTGDLADWSPDGQWLAYMDRLDALSQQEMPGVWIVKSDGSQRKQIAAGILPAWAPDSQQLAFLAPVRRDTQRPLVESSWEINIAGLDGKIRTLAQSTAIDPPISVRNGTPGTAWSPDGSMLAVGLMLGENNTMWVLDSHTGQLRWHGPGLVLPFSALSRSMWSPDSRYLVTWESVPGLALGYNGPAANLRILDTRTGKVIRTLTTGWWDWSPDGWLAFPLANNIVLATPDLSSMYWLPTSAPCNAAAWRPKH